MVRYRNVTCQGLTPKGVACRLCGEGGKLSSLEGVDERDYYFCEKCYLISVAEEQLPGEREEKERYLTHRNGIQFEGYVKFLLQAVDPALQFIKKDTVGLDYGCGPSPTVSELMARKGYVCENYDPFFVPHELKGKFGFIFSTEVFEHFFRPGEEIARIGGLLDEGGILIVMTERWENIGEFSKWYYARDNSHVCFYHPRTFGYICEEFGFEKLFDDGKRVVILRKTGDPKSNDNAG